MRIDLTVQARKTTSILLLICIFGFFGTAFAQTVTIDAHTSHQTIRGFGGMNGAGWIDNLTADQVNTAFGNDDGQMGLSIMRLRIDPNSDKWSLQVSAAQQAVANGAILLASPWTPPAYMKSNKSLIKGGRLLPKYYSAYADHLLRFNDYMASNGASLYAVSLQNEPDWHPKYESCEWTASDFVDFLLSQGPRLDALRLVAPESLNFKHALSDPFLNNNRTAGYVDIVGGHLYGAKPKDYPLARSKGKELWMTEHYTESKHSANDWPLALDVGKELHQSMVANFNAYIWWYVRRFYGLLTDDGKISKRGYLMAQYSKFVRPGFKRIAATEQPQSGVYVTAYKGPDNQLVVVAVNTNTSRQNIGVNLRNASVESFDKYTTSSTLNLGYGGNQAVSGNSASLWIDSQSVATFVGKGGGDFDPIDEGGSNKIEVRMRGVVGDESVSLLVDGNTLKTWKLDKSMTTYSHTTDASGEIRVAFTNDNGKRDVQVDYIVVNGERRQAEKQTDNSGAWGNGTCGGGSHSEWLHCNGSIGFGDISDISEGNKIEVRMRGVVGDESVNLQVGGNTLKTWKLGTSMTTYSHVTDVNGEIRVVFTNDNGKRDVQVDYIVVNGERRQAEDQDENSGAWGNGTCGGGSYSEWLHCNGSIVFGDISG
jgi:O-glycosyl hydrolase